MTQLVRTKTRIVGSAEFATALYRVLNTKHLLHGGVRSVSGPRRSGAIAAVYASYLLSVPFLHCGCGVPGHLRPHLVIDTAGYTGRTLRKSVRKMRAEFGIAVFSEPPRVRFWYENTADYTENTNSGNIPQFGSLSKNLSVFEQKVNYEQKIDHRSRQNVQMRKM